MTRIQRALIYMVVVVATTAIQPSFGKTETIDVQHSKMTVYAYKSGVLGFAGDDHQIAAPIATGSYDDAAKSVDLRVDAGKLKVLDPALDQGSRDSVQSRMMSSDVLDVAKYPTIAFRSTKVEDKGSNHWSVTGDLTLHGQTHQIVFQAMRVDAGHFTGSATVLQSAFGIPPIRVAGGLIAVRDDVKIEFDLALSP